jgi:hypothetical protein
MQKLQTYFGIRVVLTPDLDPIRLEALRDRVELIRQRYDYSPEEYHLYLHTLRIYEESSHFGFTGGPGQRLKCLGITFTVNFKQRSKGDIKFLNDEAESRLPPGVTLTSHPYEMTFSVEGTYFDQSLAFHNELIMFVRKTVKPAHRKVRATISAEPTSAFAERLGDRNLKLRSKFNRFLTKELLLRAPAKPAEPAASDTKQAVTTPSKSIFISYSRRDMRWLNRLLIHLKPFERCGLITPWSDKEIAAGQDWRREINKALDSAAVAVLLISADFMASDFIATSELPPLLQKAKNNGITIIPVIISPSAWTDLEELNWLQSLNANDRPLLGRKKLEQEEVLKKVAQKSLEVLSTNR